METDKNPASGDTECGTKATPLTWTCVKCGSRWSWWPSACPVCGLPYAGVRAPDGDPDEAAAAALKNRDAAVTATHKREMAERTVKRWEAQHYVDMAVANSVLRDLLDAIERVYTCGTDENALRLRIAIDAAREHLT